jgi:hypothetical protein
MMKAEKERFVSGIQRLRITRVLMRSDDSLSGIERL